MSRLLGFAAALCLLGSTASAQRARTPYLQSASQDGVTVVWRSAGDDPASLCYGAAPDALDALAVGTSTSAGGGVTQLEVPIAGLAEATRYYYAVGQSTCPPATPGDVQHHLTTAPATGTRGGFRFWVVGDSGTGGSTQRRVFDAMRAEAGARSPDLFIHVGDMAYGSGTTSQFDSNFYDVYASLLVNTPVWPAIGNHEGRSSDSGAGTGPYYEGYVLPSDGRSGGVPSGTEAYYSFDYANVHFIVLDSYDSPRTVSGPMVRWAEMDLSTTDQDWIVAFWHHPPYTDGSHRDNESAIEDMRRQVLPVLEAGGVDLVLGGHSHIYERSYLLRGGYHAGLPGAGATSAIVDMGDGRSDGDGPYQAEAGTVYVVAGHGGTGVSGNGRHPLMQFTELDNGSCLVDVDGGLLTLRNIRDDGVITDEVVLVQEDGIFVSQPVGGSYVAGSDIEIVWTSVGPGSGEVRVEYSLDGGGSWSMIAERTADDGNLIWTSPRRETSEGLVRVSDVSDSSRSGQSGRAFSLSREADVQLIPVGGVWEYWDQPEAPATDWATTTGGWPSGPAQLGYGDSDEATVLRDDDPNIPSAYFRRTLRVEGTLTALSARVLFDDGYALFIDGVQVGGVNVDDGVAHDTFASASSSDDEISVLDLDPSLLPAGDHVIAVIVKQGGPTSSDLSFDLSIDGHIRVPLDPPPADAGVFADGGITPTLDGGADRDGAVVGPDGGAGGEDDGCGCRAGGVGGRHSWVLYLSVLGLFWSRRRRRVRGR